MLSLKIYFKKSENHKTILTIRKGNSSFQYPVFKIPPPLSFKWDLWISLNWDPSQVPTLHLSDFLGYLWGDGGGEIAREG